MPIIAFRARYWGGFWVSSAQCVADFGLETRGTG